MYKSFFGLKENPFDVNPNPKYLVPTKTVEEALTALMYGIESRKGFITLVGEVGTGKTTLVNRLLSWLRTRRTRTAFLFNSRINSRQLFDFILAEFEIPCEIRDKGQQLLKLNKWLLDRYRAGENAVLIIDEAQNLTHPVLEEIRLLTNLETSSEKLLQIVLSGQPELEEKLKLPQLRQLRQRVMLHCKTSPLTKEETADYILNRLRIAGAGSGSEPIFSQKAMETVHMYSLGIPRVANLLCEHSLVNGFIQNQRPIEPRIVEDVAREFHLDEVELMPQPGTEGIEGDVYESGVFLQNLGEVLKGFRVGPSAKQSTTNPHGK
jgi:general secretion pathway protein A